MKRPKLPRITISKTVLIRLFFLALAGFLWVLITYAGSGFSQQVTQTIRIEDIPGVLAAESSQEVVLKAQVRTEGVRMLGLRISGLPKISISYADLTMRERKPGNFTWMVDRDFALIEEQFAGEVQLISLRPDSVIITTTPLVHKKIPVVLQGAPPLKLPYAQAGEPRLNPDSITLSGTASDLERYAFWPVDAGALKPGNHPGEFSAQLDAPEDFMGISHRTLRVVIQAVPTTAWKGKIPVRIQGVPATETAAVFPDSVAVSFPIRTDEYPRHPKAEWVAVIRYADWKDAGFPRQMQPVFMRKGEEPLLLEPVRILRLKP